MKMKTTGYCRSCVGVGVPNNVLRQVFFLGSLISDFLLVIGRTACGESSRFFLLPAVTSRDPEVRLRTSTRTLTWAPTSPSDTDPGKHTLYTLLCPDQWLMRHCLGCFVRARSYQMGIELLSMDRHISIPGSWMPCQVLSLLPRAWKSVGREERRSRGRKMTPKETTDPPVPLRKWCLKDAALQIIWQARSFNVFRASSEVASDISCFAPGSAPRRPIPAGIGRPLMMGILIRNPQRCIAFFPSSSSRPPSPRVINR